MCRCERTDEVVQAPEVSGKSYDATVLAPEDEWIAKFDHDGFKEDVKNLGKKLAEQQGPADLAHLDKIVRWQRICAWVGTCTMWYCVNPISIYLVSISIMARWTMIGHHSCHGGYDKCSDGRYNRFKFGVGSLYQRCVDWLDWMLVEAWNVEHNQLHHYCLGEELDPDLVEFNFSTMRDMDAPQWVKRVAAYVTMPVWKWFYYAPNTFKQLKIHEMRRAGKEPKHWDGTPVSQWDIDGPWTIAPSWFFSKDGPLFFTLREFFLRVLAPYFTRQFVLLPAVFGLLFGAAAFRNVLISNILAEMLTNMHSFLVIVTNHAGGDMYRFDKHCTARSGTFYLRQIISSVNFRTGNGVGKHPHGFLADLNDFHHGWLNYQIEHHVWPDLSMLSYQKAAPLLLEICKKHHVPYIQESVFVRLTKTINIMTKDESMRKFPNKWEREADLTMENPKKHD